MRVSRFGMPAFHSLGYFRDADVHPDYPLFRTPGSQVVVMSGLPASGKNKWVARHHPDRPVVSFDDARDALGPRHGQNEGAVAHHAFDAAKALPRDRRPFVWNATNLSPLMRKKTLGLLVAYGANVTLVYLEQPRAELLRRNARRDTSLTNRALEAMLLRRDLPLSTEAHAVRYEV